MRGLTLQEAKLCWKLYRQRCFGAGHMLEDNVLRGFPTHEVGAAKSALAKLIRDGILVPKSTTHGRAVYIDAALRLEVHARIREHPDFAWLPK